MSDPIILPPLHAALIRRTWLAVFLLVAADVAWMWREGIGFTPRTMVIIALAVAFLTIVAAVYRHVRRDDPIWLAAHVMNQMVLGSLALATFSYLGLLWNAPLMDAKFAALDQRLGFDWLAYIGWVEHHPAVARIFSLSYAATEPLVLVLLAALCFTRKFAQFHRFALGYLLGGLITVAVAGAVPALAEYIYRGIGPAAYPHLQIAPAIAYRDDFFAMRSHALTVLPEDFQGVVAFPSFHSVLAVLSLCAARQVSSLALRFAAIALSLLMLLSTPVDGGHYLVDTLAGIVVGLAVAWLARRWVPEGGGREGLTG
jgi:membrane-associated phospholipid phosphatase